MYQLHVFLYILALFLYKEFMLCNNVMYTCTCLLSYRLCLSLFRLPDSSTASTNHDRRKVAYVELLRRSSEPLGLGVEGGADSNQPAHIAHLRPGGVAEK